MEKSKINEFGDNAFFRNNGASVLSKEKLVLFKYLNHGLEPRLFSEPSAISLKMVDVRSAIPVSFFHILLLQRSACLARIGNIPVNEKDVSNPNVKIMGDINFEEPVMDAIPFGSNVVLFVFENNVKIYEYLALNPKLYFFRFFPHSLPNLEYDFVRKRHVGVNMNILILPTVPSGQSMGIFFKVHLFGSMIRKSKKMEFRVTKIIGVSLEDKYDLQSVFVQKEPNLVPSDFFKCRQLAAFSVVNEEKVDQIHVFNFENLEGGDTPKREVLDFSSPVIFSSFTENFLCALTINGVISVFRLTDTCVDLGGNRIIVSSNVGPFVGDSLKVKLDCRYFDRFVLMEERAKTSEDRHPIIHILTNDLQLVEISLRRNMKISEENATTVSLLHLGKLPVIDITPRELEIREDENEKEALLKEPTSPMPTSIYPIRDYSKNVGSLFFQLPGELLCLIGLFVEEKTLYKYILVSRRIGFEMEIHCFWDQKCDCYHFQRFDPHLEVSEEEEEEIARTKTEWFYKLYHSWVLFFPKLKFRVFDIEYYGSGFQYGSGMMVKYLEDTKSEVGISKKNLPFVRKIEDGMENIVFEPLTIKAKGLRKFPRQRKWQVASKQYRKQIRIIAELSFEDDPFGIEFGCLEKKWEKYSSNTYFRKTLTIDKENFGGPEIMEEKLLVMRFVIEVKTITFRGIPVLSIYIQSLNDGKKEEGGRKTIEVPSKLRTDPYPPDLLPFFKLKKKGQQIRVLEYQLRKMKIEPYQPTMKFNERTGRVEQKNVPKRKGVWERVFFKEKI